MEEENNLHDIIENGHLILAEIYRLSNSIPIDFVEPTQSKFVSLLIDFSYFDDLSIFDRLNNSDEVS